MARILGISVVVMMATSSLAMYLPNAQPSPQPCSSGDACLKSLSLSYVNNLVFCCPNGAGMSVSSIGNNVHCECGGGSFVNVGGNFMAQGHLLNASQAQPMLNNINRSIQQNYQHMMNNFHQQMANLQQQMAGLGQRLQNMFSGFNRW